MVLFFLEVTISLLTIYLFVLSLYAAPECPSDGTPVKVELNYNKTTLHFCQIKVDGKLQKHGPLKTFNSKGELISTVHYKNGILLEESPVETKRKEEQMSNKAHFKKIYEYLFVNHFDFATPLNQEAVSMNLPHGRCNINPIERGKFLAGGQKYTEKRFINTHCPVEGTVTYEMNKDIPVKYKFKAPFTYNSLSYNLYVTKVNLAGAVVTNIKMKDGLLLNEQTNESLEFSSELEFKVYLMAAVKSRGEKGVYLRHGSFKIKSRNGQKANFKRSVNFLKKD